MQALSSAANKNRVVLEAKGIVKRFGGVTALRGIDMKLCAGEVVALVGDNGAGKSTFVKILSGVYVPDEGEISVEDKSVHLDSPQRAQQCGISTVFQDLALINDRDVAHNMFLGREPSRCWGLFVDRRRMVEESAKTLAALKVRIPSPLAKVGGLSGGQKQAIAVARAWRQGGLVTLMDEPTAALGVREAGRVLELVTTLRNEGHAVLLISHNLENVFNLSDRIVILRHGTKIADMQTSDTNRIEVVSLLTSGVA